MKFVVSSDILSDHLQLTSKVMNSKNVTPVLDYILLSLKNSTLTIMGTDLQTTLVSEIEVSHVDQEGAIAIPKQLMAPLQMMSNQPITIAVDKENNSIELTSSNGRYTFTGCSAEEYPEIPHIESTTKFSIKTDVLNEGIGRTLFAVGNDEMRQIMNGVYFDIHQDDLTFVATDAHKLARYVRKDVKSDADSSFILPKKSATMLRTILVKEVEDVEVAFNEDNVAFTLPNYRLVCRLIEGTFPNYVAVIPIDNPNKAVLNRLDFLAVTKRVATVAPTETGLVKLSFTKDQLKISAENLGYAYDGEETISCQYEGESLDIGFRALHLTEMLQNLISEEVTIEMSNPSRAGLICPTVEDSTDESSLMLLMPMMLSSD
ncbi:DNA polymerase III subunit beta [Bacteroidia bacterium]|nr:DNA polymerase III subunit beta [Bacteroidia bacterium]